MTAEECFEGHARPEDFVQYTVWVCPVDYVLVIPPDMNATDVLVANKNHHLLTHMELDVLRDGSGNLGVDLNQEALTPLNIIEIPTRDQLDERPFIDKPQDPADANDALITIAAPILAGFSLAAIVTIGTTATVGPGAYPAMACFAGSAVLLLFSIQIMALGKLGGLKPGLRLRWIKALLYELGLLAFLVGLGLFLWIKTWPPAAVAGVVVGLAVICDLALVIVAWCRNERNHRQLSLGKGVEHRTPHIRRERSSWPYTDLSGCIATA